jgi:hypothetical protein
MGSQLVDIDCFPVFIFDICIFFASKIIKTTSSQFSSIPYADPDTGGLKELK